MMCALLEFLLAGSFASYHHGRPQVRKREKHEEEEEEKGSIITLEHIRLPGFVLLTTSGVNTI